MMIPDPIQLTPLEQKIYADLLRVRRRLRRGNVPVPRLPHAARVYVIARNRDSFLEYVRASKRELQSCKWVGNAEEVQGFNFSNPLVELVEVWGWAEGGVGHEKWLDACFRLIALYCRDKRKSVVPLFRY